VKPLRSELLLGAAFMSDVRELDDDFRSLLGAAEIPIETFFLISPVGRVQFSAVPVTFGLSINHHHRKWIFGYEHISAFNIFFGLVSPPSTPPEDVALQTMNKMSLR
jgi:hypothetical protein